MTTAEAMRRLRGTARSWILPEVCQAATRASKSSSGAVAIDTVCDMRPPAKALVRADRRRAMSRVRAWDGRDRSWCSCTTAADRRARLGAGTAGARVATGDVAQPTTSVTRPHRLASLVATTVENGRDAGIRTRDPLTPS